MLITELCSPGGWGVGADRVGSVPEERLLTDFNLDLTTGAPTPRGRKREFTYFNLGERGHSSFKVVWEQDIVCKHTLIDGHSSNCNDDSNLAFWNRGFLIVFLFSTLFNYPTPRYYFYYKPLLFYSRSDHMQ